MCQAYKHRLFYDPNIQIMVCLICGKVFNDVKIIDGYLKDDYHEIIEGRITPKHYKTQKKNERKQ